MNEKFLELPKEKQLRIINAGMEFFGKYGYKKAITDDIAAKAGISKGLLFYYFHNKKSFYMYLYHYCEDILANYILNSKLFKITDFFDVMSCGAASKLEILIEYPYMMNFILKAFYSQNENVKKDMDQMIGETMTDIFDKYFHQVDFSRFRDDINPRQIYEMLVWMTEGYLIDKQRSQEILSVDQMMKDFEQWKYVFKKMCYKAMVLS